MCKRYAEEKKHAGLFGRMRIWFRIERETEKEMKKRFPPSALHAASPSK